MNKIICLSVGMLILSPCFAETGITVTNVVAAQRAGTKLVDIAYDISSGKTDAAWVSITVNNDGLAISATSLSGDALKNVSMGTDKSITWDMGADWNGK